MLSIVETRRIQQFKFDQNEPLQIINCYSFGSEYNWVEPELVEHGLEFRSFRLMATHQQRVLGPCMRSIAAMLSGGGKKLLVTHQPPATRACSLMLRATGLRVPHLAYSWHYPYVPRKNHLIQHWIGESKVDAYVVHSDIEIKNGHERFHVPYEKLYTAHWQYEETPGIEEEPVLMPGDYVCTVGGSDRDYITTIEAMRRLPDIKLVLVCRPDNIEGLDIPPNVKVLTNIPRREAWNLCRHARVCLMPLLTKDSHCGHSVLVQAMHYARPCIASDARSMEGYLEPGKSALLTPVQDVEALSTAVKRLWDSPEQARAIGLRGQEFAAETFSPKAVAKEFLTLLGWN